MGLNDDLSEKLIEGWVDVLRTEAGIRGEVLSHLLLLREDLASQVAGADLARVPYRMRRKATLLKNVDQVIKDHYSDAAKTLKANLVDLTGVVADQTTGAINSVFGASVATTAFTKSDLINIVKDSNVIGTDAAKWWGKQSRDTLHRFEQQVNLGIMGGESNEDIVRRIRGKSTGQRRVLTMKDGSKRVMHEFSGGMMDTSTREATALVRTATNAASNRTLQRVYEENKEVISAQMAVATLDLKTSEICIHRDGGIWDMETGKPTADSAVKGEDFPGPPPWHFNCRTLLVPITKSWDELFGADRAKELGLNDVPDTTRASMDGQVPANLKYEDWLRKKDKTDPGMVIDKLGPSKYKLWKDGKISSRDLVDQTGNPMSVKQLENRVRRSEAGKKAAETRKANALLKEQTAKVDDAASVANIHPELTIGSGSKAAAAIDEFIGAAEEGVSPAENQMLLAVTGAGQSRVFFDSTGSIRAAISWKDLDTGAIEVRHLGSNIKGGGSNALLGILDDAAARGKAVYLESTEEAVGFYQKMGFVESAPQIFITKPDELPAIRDRLERAVNRAAKPKPASAVRAFQPDNELRMTDYALKDGENQNRLPDGVKPAKLRAELDADQKWHSDRSDYYKNLPADQKDAVDSYTRYYHELNQDLREGVPIRSADLQAKAEIMDKVIADAPRLDTDKVVYRALDLDKDLDLKPGAIVKTDGYSSTSTIPIGIHQRYGSHGFEIYMPKGSQGFAGWNPSESEILLPRGSQFRVIAKKKVKYRFSWPSAAYDSPYAVREKTIYQLEYLGPKKAAKVSAASQEISIKTVEAGGLNSSNKSWLKKQAKIFADTVDPLNESAVDEYISGRFESFNGGLRFNGAGKLSAQDIAADPKRFYSSTGRSVSQLADAIDEAEATAQDLVVYRGLDTPVTLQVGKTIRNRGFFSSSLAPMEDFVDEGGTLLRVRIAKGSEGVLTGFNNDEAELLLNHGSRFKVAAQDTISIQLKSGATKKVKMYDLEYLGPRGAAPAKTAATDAKKTAKKATTSKFLPDGEPRLTTQKLGSDSTSSALKAEYAASKKEFLSQVPEERQWALEDYIQGESADMNQYLRRSSVPGSTKDMIDALASKTGETQQQIVKIAKAIDVAPATDRDLVVYRGVVGKAPLGAPETGSIHQTKGFFSSSTVANGNHISAADEIYEVLIPKGSKGVLSGLNEQEFEVLLNHGSRFRVIDTAELSFKGVSGTKRVIRLEYISP